MPSSITLYTAHHCPWAQRAQIALRELDLEFETVLVNINIPRTPEYLGINPRGLVPTLVHDGHVLTESGLITQFLVDLYPSHLLKSSSEPDGALQRFNVTFFVESYFTKAHCHFDTAVVACDEEETTAAQKYIDGIVNHIEPLLEDAAPFFGGSSRLTFAEVCLSQTEVTINSLLYPIIDLNRDLGSDRIVPSPSDCTTQACRNSTWFFYRGT
jgi:glutathione S-transferase